MDRMAGGGSLGPQAYNQTHTTGYENNTSHGGGASILQLTTAEGMYTIPYCHVVAAAAIPVPSLAPGLGPTSLVTFARTSKEKSKKKP